MSTTRSGDNSGSLELEDPSDYLSGSELEGYKVLDTTCEEDANYGLCLVTPAGKISSEAKLTSLILDNHPDDYLPEMGKPEQFKTGNRLIEKEILDEDYNVRPEIPDHMLEYAQAATVSEHTDEVNLEDLRMYTGDTESKEEWNHQWFDDYGRDLVRKLDEMDKPIANSKIISEDLDATPSQVGSGIGIMQRKYGGDFVHSIPDGRNWNVKKMQEELDLEEIAEEGLEAI